MAKKNNEELEKLYQESEQCDKDVFSEQRSNILLVSGEHYSRQGRRHFTNRIRDSRAITDEQKLRLTKNHTNRISQIYKNSIATYAPGVTVFPHNDSELQDQKTAELNKSVWEDIKTRHKINQKIREFIQDFVEIGEVAVKIFWDPNKGNVVGYSETTQEEMQIESAQEVLNMGMAQQKGEPIFEGDFCFERIYGFNILRAPEAKSWDDSPYVILRKMVPVSKLKKIYNDQPEKLSKIQPEQDETYVIFESKNGKYSADKNQALIQEFYYRPSMEYPQGYFYIKTRHGILEEGELPFGIFPIAFKQFQEFQTSPRGRSIIKQLRPYQIEINRTASAIATHQLTIGDDKLVINTSGKVEQGASLPGVRVIKTNGFGNPTIIPGRTGEQYLPYLQSQISEMYEIAGVSDLGTEKSEVADPMVMLMRSVKQKKQFSIYVQKFEEFLVDMATITLKLAKQYYDDNRLVPAIGRREFINIPEFRTVEDIGTRIKLEARSDDIETSMGKQLVLNHILQYSSSQLSSEQIGKLIRTMPFANSEETFSDLTIDYDNAKNLILALDRGEDPLLSPHDNHQYMIQKITHRMRQADFNFLAEEIKAKYQEVISQYQDMEAAQQAEIQRAQAGFIPSGGYLVKADFYINDEDGKTKRATIPYQALEWLLTKLDEQGMSQENLESMDQGNQAAIAEMMAGKMQQSPGQGQQGE